MQVTNQKEECNLVLYTKAKAKKSSYDMLMDHAKGIASEMSDRDKRRLQANPTPEMLKKIMENNDE